MNKFKVEGTGVRLTKALFVELNHNPKTKDRTLYTLKDEDHKGFPSLYKLYMAMEDLTEYEFANKYLDGWDHWNQLCSVSWFRPYVQRWREELELKLKARSLATIIDDAMSGNSKTAVASAKYLIAKGWLPQESSTSLKERAKREAEKYFESEGNQRVEDDMERIFGTNEVLN